MPKNFRRGPLPLCRTTALRIVYSTQPMVGPDTVTDARYDKGRFREPSFVSIAIVHFHRRPNGYLRSNFANHALWKNSADDRCRLLP
jgi:hypothetical protein